MADSAPRVFVSYSHDSQAHKDWVRTLSERLIANGVDIILDQYGLRPGGDLPGFMESGLTDADRVLAICSSTYVAKANAEQGGTGYEKMILSAQIMKNVPSRRVIPIIRGNEDPNLLPTFLLSRLYIDFRDDTKYEERYAGLVREIHGVEICPRPILGTNPFGETIVCHAPNLSSRPERYVSPPLSGTVTFDPSDNDGRYVLGSGDMRFNTRWSVCGQTAIYVYADEPNVRTIAIADKISAIPDIEDASIYNSSSTHRAPQLGEIVVWENSAGYFAATQILKLQSRFHGDSLNEVVFSYIIQANRTPSFKDS